MAKEQAEEEMRATITDSVRSAFGMKKKRHDKSTEPFGYLRKFCRTLAGNSKQSSDGSDSSDDKKKKRKKNKKSRKRKKASSSDDDCSSSASSSAPEWVRKVRKKSKKNRKEHEDKKEKDSKKEKKERKKTRDATPDMPRVMHGLRCVASPSAITNSPRVSETSQSVDLDTKAEEIPLESRKSLLEQLGITDKVSDEDIQERLVWKKKVCDAATQQTLRELAAVQGCSQGGSKNDMLARILESMLKELKREGKIA